MGTKATPKFVQVKTPAPQATQENIPVPTEQKTDNKEQSVQQRKTNPQYHREEIPVPIVGHPQNQVTIDGILVQIKPTKLKYQRDQTWGFYKILKQAPVVQILGLADDFFDQNKTPDKMLFDWIVAVLDDPKFVTRHYDNIDCQAIDKMLQITCRLNGIDEREERKNRLAQAAAKNH